MPPRIRGCILSTDKRRRDVRDAIERPATVFVIRMQDGEEIHITGGDQLSINPKNGVITVEQEERHGDVTTHYSPMAWRSVTHRVKRGSMRSRVPSGDLSAQT